jgi:hypothetical protein
MGESTARGLPRYAPALLLYLGGYIAILAFFKGVDVYHAHFASRGLLVVLYNYCRVVFIFYLFWIVHFAGATLLQWVNARAWADLSPLDRLAVGFFAGTGVWHVVLLALGFLGLYTVPAAVILTVPVVALSFRYVAEALPFVRAYRWPSFRSVAAALRFARAYRWPRPRRAAEWMTGAVMLLAVLSLTAAGAALLMTKGLLPGGGHDYYTHYFYYYQTVIDRGNLWPNDVWYHFYYSKGAGLYFLAMLLTDSLAPQLVTSCFFAAAALFMYSLVRTFAPGSLWPWAAVTLLCCVYIYTPGVAEYRTNGGWGEFQKLHELNAALVFAIVCMTGGAVAAGRRDAAIWAVAAISAIVAAVLINITISAYLGGVFAILALGYAVQRRAAHSVLMLTFAAAAGATLLVQFTINHLVTGLLSDQGLPFFWQFADPEKLYRWGALPQVIGIVLSTAGLPISSNVAVEPLFVWARLDLLYPLAAFGVLGAGAALLTWRFDTRVAPRAGVLIGAYLGFVVFGLVTGLSQPISFFRYASFIVAITIALAIALWSLPRAAVLGRFGRMISAWVVPPAVVAACIAAIVQTFPNGIFTPFLKEAARFARGADSIELAYTWDGRPPGNGIRAPARAAFSLVGPKVRIWSFHIHTYCMLPGCRIETNFSFLMSPRWADVMFGTPEEARRVLQAEGLNYFLYWPATDIRDPLPLSQLFSPDNIGRYFGIAWTDDDAVLLTWREASALPLDDFWTDHYRASVKASGSVSGYPYAAMKSLYEQLQKTPHPWRRLELPVRHPNGG